MNNQDSFKQDLHELGFRYKKGLLTLSVSKVYELVYREDDNNTIRFQTKDSGTTEVVPYRSIEDIKKFISSLNQTHFNQTTFDKPLTGFTITKE